jgi:hypothetical protein
MRASAPGTGFEFPDAGNIRMLPISPSPEPPPDTPPAAGGLWLRAAIALIGLVIGAGGVALVTSRGLPARSGGSTDEATSSRAVPRSAQPAYSGAPKWEGGRAAGRGRRAEVTYGVTAENEIAIWGGRVRPVLTVRCSGGVTDVFVLTESAAKVEESKDHRTVHVAIDEGPERIERWVESADYDALFAPDGPAMAREIAAGRTLRFGFTPYNAVPAVAEFDIRGFDRLIDSVAKSCRWK